ncbi:MAG: tRNA (cytidine(34)-2'-O)-methyltransferase [Eggerthellaceae bacterium]
MTTQTPNAHIVLLQPEIPQNTGNIARTCACTDCTLTVVDPLGFQLSERRMKRAGLDYWDDVFMERIPSTDEFFARLGDRRFFLFTGHAERSFADVAYEPGDYLVFGRESRGIDADVLERYEDRCVRIPMAAGERSLNLANSVAIAVYEVLRQTGYPHVG